MANAQNMGQTGGQQNQGQGIVDKAKDVASNVADRARDVASGVADRADSAMHGVGERMTNLADRLRSNAPSEGMIGSAAGTVADNLRSAGEYLRNKDLGDVGGDITNLVKTYPMYSLLAAVGIGYLLGTALSRR